MIKSIFGFLLIASILFLNACSIGGARTHMLSIDNDGGKADARLKQIIKAINNQDKNSIKNMFSNQAKNKTEDLDGQIDYLFVFVQGKIESWETIVHGATAESINNGSRIKGSNSWYYIYTDKQKYLIFLVECTIDTDHPENVGMYVIQVMKAEDKDKYFHGGGPDTLPAGIDIPDGSTVTTT
ncbi:DUF5104 domain-containing protein [Oscillospiraceae bacterium CM]|nr:DUF5104 domain-containing protein [Oscillospiraceae bacterium CM]